MRKKPIIETGDNRHQRQPVQEREIAAENEEKLEAREHQARDVPKGSWSQKEEGRNQLGQVIVESSELVKPVWEKVQQWAERVGNRLGLIVVVETGQVAPARIASKFDQSRSQHDPENQPPKEP